MIDQLLVETGLVTISGLGGLGKTRIALSIADRWRSRGSEVIVVDLAAMHRADLVPDRIASSLGLQETVGSTSEEAVIRNLGDRPCLLILDAFERVVAAAGFVRSLVRQTTGVFVLVTSRLPLRIAGEREVPLGPLALPTSDSAEAVRSSPAGALFLREAERIGSRIETEDCPAVGAVCRHLAGIPLGIVLAAARTRLFSPAALAQRLAADLPTLPRASDGSDALGRVLGWTIDLLPQAERDRFIDLAVVPGTFDLRLAAALWRLPDAVELLDTIVRLGLVRRAGRHDRGPDRFELMVPVRDEAMRQLHVRGDEATVMRRLVDDIEARTEAWQVALRGRTQVVAAAEISAEIDTIRSVLDWLSVVDPPAAARIVIRLDAYWSRHRLREGGAWALALLGRVRIDSAATVQLLKILALTELFLVGPEPAIEHATRMLDVALAASSPELEMQARFMLGMAYGSAGTFDRSIDELRRAATIADDTGDRVQLARILGNLGVTYADAGRLDLASAALREAVAASRMVGDDFALAMNLVNLTETLLFAGEPDTALKAADEGWALLDGYDPGRYTAFAMLVRSGALAATGSVAAARSLLASAARFVAEIDETEGKAQLLEYAAYLSLAEGRRRDAARLLGTALRLWRVGGQSDDPARHIANASVGERLRHLLGEERFSRLVGEGMTDEPNRVVMAIAASVPELDPAIQGKFGRLSPREGEVLELVAAGATDGDIAAALSISPKTASVHVSNLKNKLGSDSRIELALLGRQLLDRRPSRGSETDRSSSVARL
jgi:predicted ATPase/DNA-binding CsgD family transcriptional regulator